ncbi:hypothetical protein AB0E56_05850 [Microbacterium sp. NPDC028030]|uniref:hypothetical protein n=1 Tax=Microbacterium sp. NPDC028030 TaxID=3155124 RepID=UPI0033EE220A
MSTREAAHRATAARGIHRAAWSWWSGLNVILPVVLAVLAGLLMPRSPGMLALIPVTVLAMVLGSLPRAVLRWRKATALPPPVTWLVFLNAWGWTIAASAPLLLSRWSDAFDGVERGYTAVVVVAGLAWSALLVCTIFVPLDAEPAPRWTRLAWTAATVTPFVLVAMLAIGLVSSDLAA